MTDSYGYAVAYFLFFSLLLLISGTMLFEHKIGFSADEITTYYLGSSEQFINPKTYSGILKTALPHIVAFGIFFMVLLHFLVFTKYRNIFSVKTLIYLSFTSAFFEIFSPFFILMGVDAFAYVKLLSFLLLQIFVLYIAWLLFRSLFKN